MCVRRNHNTGTSAGGLAKTVIALPPATILLHMRILRCWRHWLRKHAPRHACKKCQQYQRAEVTGAVESGFLKFSPLAVQTRHAATAAAATWRQASCASNRKKRASRRCSEDDSIPMACRARSRINHDMQYGTFVRHLTSMTEAGRNTIRNHARSEVIAGKARCGFLSEPARSFRICRESDARQWISAGRFSSVKSWKACGA